MSKPRFNTLVRMYRCVESRADGELAYEFEVLGDMWALVDARRSLKSSVVGVTVQQADFLITTRYSRNAASLQAKDKLMLPGGTELQLLGPARGDDSGRYLYLDAVFWEPSAHPIMT